MLRLRLAIRIRNAIPSYSAIAKWTSDAQEFGHRVWSMRGRSGCTTAPAVLPRPTRGILASIGAAVQPIPRSEIAVPGIAVRKPFPIQLVQSTKALRPHRALRLVIQGPFANAVPARDRYQITKQIHRSNPTTPCSQRIRVYSFSVEMGFFTCPSRKKGMLVPPPPNPLPIG